MLQFIATVEKDNECREITIEADNINNAKEALLWENYWVVSIKPKMVLV